ncbi:MAG: hypothetical protein J2O48_08305 [Solirubrobacterales bacterium]|nr:hypothetical protein [Solirubrobacterales bacterium]
MIRRLLAAVLLSALLAACSSSTAAPTDRNSAVSVLSSQMTSKFAGLLHPRGSDKTSLQAASKAFAECVANGAKATGVPYDELVATNVNSANTQNLQMLFSKCLPGLTRQVGLIRHGHHHRRSLHGD